MQAAIDVACGGCARAIDPLRAGHVAIFDGRIRYFCDLPCRGRWLDTSQRALVDALAERSSSEGASARVTSNATPTGALASVDVETEMRAVEAVERRAAAGSSAPTLQGDSARGSDGFAHAQSAGRSLAVEGAHEHGDDASAHAKTASDRQPNAHDAGDEPPGLGKQLRNDEPARADAHTRGDGPVRNDGLVRNDEPARNDEHEHAATEGDIDALLLGGAMLGGVLAVALMLAGGSPAVIGARVIVAGVACAALVARVAGGRREPADAHPIALLAAPTLACVLAAATALMRDVLASEATSVAGIIVAAAASLVFLRARAVAEVDAERHWVTDALALPGRRVARGDVTIVASHELRAGEQLAVGVGEICPADLLVTSGTASVYPWLGMTTPVQRGPGDALVAGARIVEGNVRGTATWTGNDRAWARLLLDPARRADVHTGIATLARKIAELGAAAAAGLAALASFANGAPWAHVALAAIAAYASLATTAVGGVVSIHVARAVLAAARRGIAYRDASAWDAAARATAAMFAARGTLLLGEPDVIEVESTGSAPSARVLALAAGAESNQYHPTASAIRRAAEHRAVAPDAVRSPNPLPGLGVTAVTSTGEALLFGSRALMLEQRVSIALAEERVTELEGLGRTVLLVSAGGKLVGLVALQDGLRPGARAAVQHLLDVDVEPVLLSGDARETCETIARALDIDHVRPEVLPADRAGEARRLAEGGARVAVIGRPDADASVLSAADVAIALGAAGTAPNEWSVTLAGDDVRDAALALAIAHRTAAEAKTALVLAVAPGIVGALVVAFGLLPPVFAPLAGLVGGFVTLVHARGVISARREAPLTAWDLTPPELTPPHRIPRIGGYRDAAAG